MWPKKSFNIFADISTYCNAGCPQCHRTNPDGLGKAEWLPLIQWSLEDFKRAFPPSTLDLCSNMQICGTWGDPVMNKDLMEICRYIIDSTWLTTIIINTNGSIRDEDWWWELGAICGKRLMVVFAVDGKDQYQHQLYRKFTDLDKVLNNMEAISTTRTKVRSQTIVFEHNQNDLNQIKQMCYDRGVDEATFVWTDRFERGEDNKFKYTNPDGSSYTLVKANKKVEQTFNNFVVDRQPRDNGCISCKWLHKREVVVNPDGQVLPCCYIANGYYTWGAEYFKNDLMMSYKHQEKQNNVFHRPLEEILSDSEWFNEELPESWLGDKPLKQCVRWCSSKGDKYDSNLRVSSS